MRLNTTQSRLLVNRSLALRLCVRLFAQYQYSFFIAHSGHSPALGTEQGEVDEYGVLLYLCSGLPPAYRAEEPELLMGWI